MLVEVKVPQLSESVAEATLLNWHKQAGQYVNRDENLVDIETDKVVLETPAPQSGVLVKIMKGDGGTVTSNEVIAQIDTEAAKPAAAPKAAAAPAAKPAPAAAAEAKPAAKKAAPAPVMPAAQKLAAEKDVDTQALSGTGRGGRVTKGDVLQALTGPSPAAENEQGPRRAENEQGPRRAENEQGPRRAENEQGPRRAENEQGKPRFPPLPPSSQVSQPSAPQREAVPQRAPAPAVDVAALGERPEQRVPMSRLRARIAERLVQSQATAAILTTFNEVNMQPVMDLRSRYRDRFEKEHGVKLGFMSFFVKAAVHALKKYPIVNASVDGSDIVYHGYYDIGIAVGSPRGLVVPILRDADQLSLAEIEKRIADFGQRAQAGKLTIEELTGGTFSISNGGVFGSMLSTPIINPPQSAILGIHATKERAVVENGQIVARPMNYLALSYDHRIIDGREAVLSLVAMKEALEDPARMLLEI